MNLYEVWICNGLDYDDEVHFTKIVVAENEQQALDKVIKSKECYFYNYETFENSITLLDVVDGYEISLNKI